ncbi:MAG: hypothetical protein AAB955_03955 [Patescibacteria group bacterium]|mgnify:CR=1
MMGFRHQEDGGGGRRGRQQGGPGFESFNPQGQELNEKVRAVLAALGIIVLAMALGGTIVATS